MSNTELLAGVASSQPQASKTPKGRFTRRVSESGSLLNTLMFASTTSNCILILVLGTVDSKKQLPEERQNGSDDRPIELVYQPTSIQFITGN